MKTLDIDERQFTPTNVRFLYLHVGEVATKALARPPAFGRPDADRFGKAVVDRLACGRWEVTPYILHTVFCWFLSNAGEYLTEKMMASNMKQMVIEIEQMGKRG